MAEAATTADYMVGATIREGFFGRVVHGRHKVTDRAVAVKVVHKVSIKKRPDQLVHILTERRVLEELKQCHAVVNLWACFHDNECLYFVMECAMGGDLTSVISAGVQEADWIDSAKHYAMQILAALEAVHVHKILHADLKPDNILVTLQGRVQLADFGSAVELLKKNDTYNSNNRKDRPVVRGTSDYASPEILRAKHASELTVAVDLWSFGCVLFALLQGGGESPFHASSDALAVDKILDFCKKEDATSTTKAAVATTNDRESVLFGKDNVGKEPCIPKDWRELILTLLQPEPLERLGAHDMDPVDGSSPYGSIRASTVWKDVDLEKSPKFLPKEPTWLVESNSMDMKDGSEGWTAFLDIA